MKMVLGIQGRPTYFSLNRVGLPFTKSKLEANNQENIIGTISSSSLQLKGSTHLDIKYKVLTLKD